MVEEFRGYHLDKDYLISNLGNVKSLKSNKLLKLSTDRYGYLYVSLKGNVGKKKKIHRLVAETFIDNPLNKPQVNHINAVKTDNRVENLEWVTQYENNKHWNEKIVTQCQIKAWGVKRRGFKHSKETCGRMSESRKGEMNGRSLRVKCLENGKIYKTKSECALDLNISFSHMYDKLKTKALIKGYNLEVVYD